MKKLSLLFILGLAVLASCSKDDSGSSSKKDLLCGKYWKITTLTIDPSFQVPGGGLTNNLFAVLDPCVQDDVVMYNTNGTSISDAKVKCEVSDPQTITGTWSFNSDETIITETDIYGSVSYTILESTKTSLKATYKEKIGEVTYTVTLTAVPAS